MYEELISRLKNLAMLTTENGKSEIPFSAEAVQAIREIATEAADAIEELSKVIEAVNDAHNEGYDVGYWAGRRDYEPKWIPVTEQLPEDGEAVNVAWINHSPAIYYPHIKDKSLTATGVYYRGQWYWWSAVVQDYLAEYGEWGVDKIDTAIEITHWMPLPAPPKEET